MASKPTADVPAVSPKPSKMEKNPREGSKQPDGGASSAIPPTTLRVSTTVRSTGSSSSQPVPPPRTTHPTATPATATSTVDTASALVANDGKVEDPPKSATSDGGNAEATQSVYSRMSAMCFNNEGMDCFADDREALNDFEKYFNNAHLSDVKLMVGEEIFFAHRIILTKSSEVFERMLSQKWDGYKKEIELVEEPSCIGVFGAFLRFLYCNHVLLQPDNTLPLLILADKYNVIPLRKVCIDYAMNHIIPYLTLKDLYHVWFQYGSKSFHEVLINACIQTLASCFDEIITSPEWEKEWLTMDRDQLGEFLKCGDLNVPNEYDVWQAVVKWLQAPQHSERRGNTAAPLLANIIPLIRFPFMTPDELSQVERHPLAEQQSKLFQPHILLAYKFQALPLSSRVNRQEFSGAQFLLRNYSDLRWDKRLVITEFSSYQKYTEVTLKLSTRASAVPAGQAWDWELKVHPQGFSSASEELRCILSSNVMLDQTRAVEYLLSIVDKKRVLKAVAGKKTFTKTRYCADLEMDKRVTLEELHCENSPLLDHDNLYLQLTLKPID